MKVEIRNRNFREIEYFFPRRKMFQWGEIIGTGVFASICIWLTVFLSNLPDSGDIQNAAYNGLKAVFILMDVIVVLTFLIEVIPYKYIIQTVKEEAETAVREEMKGQIKEIPNDLLLLMKEQITEELLERKEEERVKVATYGMYKAMIKYDQARRRIEEEKKKEV